MKGNNNLVKIIGIILIGIFAIFFAVPLITKLAFGLLGLVLKLAIPVLVVGGILYAIYHITGADKSLPGNRKRLP
jgi:predicted membrane channel-forming protein YqfA (hemolysin III family)